MSKEVIAAFPLNCEGIPREKGEPPLKKQPTSISVTIFQEDEQIVREVGCAYLDNGRCDASSGQPCIHLFPQSSSKLNTAVEKITSPAGHTVAIDPIKLRSLREESRLTQQQLADAARSGHSIIWKLERANIGPTRTKIARAELIANRLGVELQDIVFDPDKATVQSRPTINEGDTGRNVG